MFMLILLTFVTSHIASGLDTTLPFEKTPKFECGISYGGPIVQQINKEGVFMDGLYWDCSIQKLLFVDKTESNINWYDLRTGITRTIHINETENQRFSNFVPVEGAPTKYVLSTEQDLYLITDLGSNGSHPYTIKHLMKVINDSTGNELFNKGSVSANHNFWLGVENRTVIPTTTKEFEILKVNIGANVTVMDNHVENPSGLGWNKENTLFYVVDDKANLVYQYDYHLENSTISNKTTVFDISKYSNKISGVLSGLTVDTQGHLWIGVWKGTCVIRVDPSTQTLEEIISVPATEIIALTFGGRHFDILFVGTTNYYLSNIATEPDAGTIFAISGTGRRGSKSYKVYVPSNLLS